MDEGDRCELSRMPLAEGVEWLWRYVLDEAVTGRTHKSIYRIRYDYNKSIHATKSKDAGGM